MRSRTIAAGIVSSIAVLVMGWQAGGQAALETSTGTSASAPLVDGTTTDSSGTTDSGTSDSDTSDSTASGSTGTADTSTGSSDAATTDSGSATATEAAGVSGTFTGAASSTRYGDVQVEITVANGTITDVTALQLTSDGSRSTSINASAVPTLKSEALAAQSASIQSVSGATYTSQGYITSLQSAIDEAGL